MQSTVKEIWKQCYSEQRPTLASLPLSPNIECKDFVSVIDEIHKFSLEEFAASTHLHAKMKRWLRLSEANRFNYERRKFYGPIIGRKRDPVDGKYFVEMIGKLKFGKKNTLLPFKEGSWPHTVLLLGKHPEVDSLFWARIGTNNQAHLFAHNNTNAFQISHMEIAMMSEEKDASLSWVPLPSLIFGPNSISSITAAEIYTHLVWDDDYEINRSCFGKFIPYLIVNRNSIGCCSRYKQKHEEGKQSSRKNNRDASPERSKSIERKFTDDQLSSVFDNFISKQHIAFLKQETRTRQKLWLKSGQKKDRSSFRILKHRYRLAKAEREWNRSQKYSLN